MTERRIGNYVLGSVLSSGSAGQVYECEVPWAHGVISCAALLVELPHASDPRFLATLAAEVPSALRFAHPNAARLVEVVRETGDAVLVVWERGETYSLWPALDRAERAGFELPKAQALFITETLANMMRHAHQHPWRPGDRAGLVHGVINPASVRVGIDGGVLLTGVGLGHSRALLPFSPYKDLYRAPEVREGGHLSSAADVYGLTRMLYRLLSHACGPLGLWSPRDPVPLELPKLNTLGIQIPPDLLQIIEDGQAVDPTMRPSMSELISALGEAIEQPLEVSRRELADLCEAGLQRFGSRRRITEYTASSRVRAAKNTPPPLPPSALPVPSSSPRPPLNDSPPFPVASAFASEEGGEVEDIGMTDNIVVEEPAESCPNAPSITLEGSETADIRPLLEALDRPSQQFDVDLLVARIVQGAQNPHIEEEEKRHVPSGTMISGRYRIEYLLGEGGVAQVYRAQHVLLEKPVAVKLLRPELSANAALVARFRREAQAVSQLDHPNIVRVSDFGHIHDDRLFLVMDLVTGRPLSEYARKPVSAYKAGWILNEVLSGLSHAHRHAIVHRDLKPENIMISEDFGQLRVRILDFGIAKLGMDGRRSITQAGTVFGTPRYMAPEQAAGDAVDPRADLYAIGVILYFLLTGRVPFDGDNTVQILSRVLTQDPPPIDLPGEPRLPQIQAFWDRALAKEPSDRFESAEAMQIALREVTR